MNAEDQTTERQCFFLDGRGGIYSGDNKLSFESTPPPVWENLDYRNPETYKILVEESGDYPGYQVIDGRLDFVEPDRHGQLFSPVLDYDDDELAYASTLLTPVGNADKCGMKPVSVISGIRQKISIFPPQS